MQQTNTLVPSRDRATPIQLGQEILKLVSDADDNTARVALRIAELLLDHRKLAEIEFMQATAT
jgi:hypothetical protein